MRNSISSIRYRLLIGAWLVLVSLFCLACRGNGSSVTAGQKARPVTPSQPAATPKPTTIRSGIGFATRQKFFDHYEKHGAEFGSPGKEAYLLQAQTLRDQPAGGDILEAVRADGVITRFNRRTGAFLAFNKDLTIRTYFKPNDGESYFRRQSKRPAKED